MPTVHGWDLYLVFWFFFLLKLNGSSSKTNFVAFCVREASSVSSPSAAATL